MPAIVTDPPDSPPPHFIVVGVMKAGTTSVFRWLQAHPGVADTAEKEPNYFCDDAAFPGGRPDPDRLTAYRRLLAAEPGLRAGEASVRYTFPEHAASAAARIEAVAPDAQLLCVLRDPVERLRSHYRYWVMRAREQRPLAEAVAGADNPYVTRSRYDLVLAPYLDRFGPDRLAVVTFEAVVGDGGDTWSAVLAHLGLAEWPRPTDAHNVTSEDRQYTPLARDLLRRGVLQHTRRLPGPLRRIGGKVLLRRGADVRAELDRSHDPLPQSVVDELAGGAQGLADRLGWDTVPWELAAG